MDKLPTELLIHILSLVECKDLVNNCRLVSRKWKEVVDSVALRRKAEMHCSQNVLKTLQNGKNNETVHSWQIYYLMLNNVFARNLLRNNCGQNKMEYWRPCHTDDIGTKWKVEEYPEGSDFLPENDDFGACRCCFSPSSRYSSKYQIIRLKDFGLTQRIMDQIRPVIRIREWYYLSDCNGGRMNQSKVQLLDKRRCVIDSFSLEINEKAATGVWQSMEYEFKSYRKGVRFIKFLHSATVGCKLGGGSIAALAPPPHYHRHKELTARLCRTQTESDDCYETDSDGDFKFDLKYEFYKYIKKNSASEKELLSDYSKYRIKAPLKCGGVGGDPFYDFYQSRIKNWRSHCNKGALSSPEVRLATSRFKELLQKYSWQGDHFDAQALAQASCDLDLDGCYQLEHDLDESYQLFMSSNSVNTFFTLFPKPPCRQICSDDSCNHEMASADVSWHCHRLCCHYFDSNAEKDADALLCKYVLLRHFGRKYYRKHHKRA